MKRGREGAAGPPCAQLDRARALRRAARGPYRAVRLLGLAVAVVAFAAGLAGLLWLAAHFIAPPLFGALWRGTSAPWTAQMLAVLPALTREWGLTPGGAAGLTIAVQAGFIVGPLLSALTNLPDAYSARTVMKLGIVLGAVTNAALALWVASLWPALILRFTTGVCLAGEYPPDRAADAHRAMEGGGLRGRAVIVF